MKPVLAWIKSNVLVVVFSAIILVILPTAWIVSNAWGRKVRLKQESDAKAQLQQIEGARVDYSLPALDPAVQPVTFKSEPNSAVTEWFRKERERLLSQATQVVQRAVDFNKGVGGDAVAVGRTEHKPLVEGLFPSAGGNEASKLNEFEDAILGQRGFQNPYARILNDIGAGGPADPISLRTTIQAMRDREREKITANKRELTAEEDRTLGKMLTDRRMAEYKARARAISVYADMSAFPSDAKEGSVIPVDRINPQLIKPVPFFLFQWDLWVYSDLFSAVRLANTGADGKPTPLETSVVKRVEKIVLKDPDGLYNPEPGAMTDTAPAAPTAAVAGMVPVDPALSVTGRGMGDWNKVYDVRRASIKVVVSSARLQEFLNAIAQTNFMTVTDLDLEEVDVWNDLRQGFYYGDEHVVRATVGIESVWLRSWTAPLMPRQLANVLGVPEPAPAEGAGPG